MWLAAHAEPEGAGGGDARAAKPTVGVHRGASRSPGLDVLRAGAILWVMLYHASLFGIVPADHWWIGRGWMGVDLFFALSGFLIGEQLLASRARGEPTRLWPFWRRRLFRTIPAYVAVLAIYFVFPAARERPAIQPLWQFLTFTENMLIDFSMPKAFSHVWSLCVEEQFYLILPLAVALAFLRRSARTTILCLAGLVLLGMAARAFLWLGPVTDEPFSGGSTPDPVRYMELIYYPTWSRLDGLLAGVAMATIKVFKPKAWDRARKCRRILLGAGLGCVAASILLFPDQIGSIWAAVFGYPLLSLGFALLVIAADGRATSFLWRVPGAGALAASAYSLYLTHKLVFGALARFGASIGITHPAAIVLTAALGAALAGAALYWSVERPFLRLRDRLYASRASKGSSTRAAAGAP